MTTKKMNLDGVISNQGTDYPIRLAMYLLPLEEDATNVMRLFVSSVLCASMIAPSKMKLVSPILLSNIDVAMGQVAAALTEDEAGIEDALMAVQMPKPSWVHDDITALNMKDVLEINPQEVYAFAGSLCMAVTKQPTAENLSAFMGRRAALATLGFMSDNPVVFTENSDYLTLPILTKIHKAASFHMLSRELTMRALATNISLMDDGNQYVFACFLMLLENSGMNSLNIIRKVLMQYPTLIQFLPHLNAEFQAADAGISKVMALPNAERSFCKSIYGSKFVPVQYSDIKRLLGICVYIGQKAEPNLANFKGGQLAEMDKDIIDHVFGETIELKELGEEEEEGGQQPGSTRD